MFPSMTTEAEGHNVYWIVQQRREVEHASDVSATKHQFQQPK